MGNKKIQIKKKYVLVVIATGTDTFVSEIIDFTGKNEQKIRGECGLWYSRNINRNYCEKPWRYVYIATSPKRAQQRLNGLIREKNNTRFTKGRKIIILCQLVLASCFALLTMKLLVLGYKDASMLPFMFAVLFGELLFCSIFDSQTHPGSFREERRKSRSNGII